VRIHLRIISRLAAGGEPKPNSGADDGENQDAGANPDARLL
jgi:hypothetical protein